MATWCARALSLTTGFYCKSIVNMAFLCKSCLMRFTLFKMSKNITSYAIVGVIVIISP